MVHAGRRKGRVASEPELPRQSTKEDPDGHGVSSSSCDGLYHVRVHTVKDAVSGDSGSASARVRKLRAQPNLARVVESEEALLVYEPGSEGARGSREPQLRVPVFMSSARQAPRNEKIVCVTLPSRADLERFKGMQVAPQEPRSRFQGEPKLPPGETSLALECGSVKDARRLLDALSRAGCMLRCFARRYSLHREVGHGGFGRVFLAEDAWTGEDLAVKIITRACTSAHLHPLRESTMLRWANHTLFPQFKSLCLLSAQELSDLNADLDSPLGIEEGAGSFAIVTEFVDGVELLEVLSQGPLPVELVKILMRQLFEGLSVLHEIGIVHRDIKPENILLPAKGDGVKLVDFGLSCLEWDQEAAKIRAGSMGYVAPELLSKCAMEKRFRTTKLDCFGAGAVLYTCLAGKGPFSGRNMAEVRKRNSENRIRVESVATFPKSARQLVAHLMSTRPDERPDASECIHHAWLQVEDVSEGSEAEISEVLLATPAPSSGVPSSEQFCPPSVGETPSERGEGSHAGHPRAVQRSDGGDVVPTAEQRPAAEQKPWRGLCRSVLAPKPEVDTQDGPSSEFTSGFESEASLTAHMAQKAAALRESPAPTSANQDILGSLLGGTSCPAGPRAEGRDGTTSTSTSLSLTGALVAELKGDSSPQPTPPTVPPVDRRTGEALRGQVAAVVPSSCDADDSASTGESTASLTAHVTQSCGSTLLASPPASAPPGVAEGIACNSDESARVPIEQKACRGDIHGRGTIATLAASSPHFFEASEDTDAVPEEFGRTCTWSRWFVWRRHRTSRKAAAQGTHSAWPSHEAGGGPAGGVQAGKSCHQQAVSIEQSRMRSIAQRFVGRRAAKKPAPGHNQLRGCREVHPEFTPVVLR